MQNRKGFTLIELLVVIAIIGLLSTLAIVALGTARLKSRDARRLADLKQIQTALEMYYSDSSSYPLTPGSGGVLGENGANVCLNLASGFTSANCPTPFLGIVPKDPGSSHYIYNSGGTSTYFVSTTLEGSVGGFTGPQSIRVTQNGLSQP